MHLKSPLTQKQKLRAKQDRAKLASQTEKESKKMVRRILPPTTKPLHTNTRWTRPGSATIPSKETFGTPDSCTVKNDVPDSIRLKYRNQLASLYPKGPYQLVTGESMVKDLGKKSSQLEELYE